MAKVSFGEYSAFSTQGGIRFQKHNKLVSEKSVPPEVVDYLTKKVNAGQEVEKQTEAAKHPLPTEEEKARLREESMEVPPELERTEEEMAQARADADVLDDVQADMDALSGEDFTEEDKEPVDESTTVPDGATTGVAQVTHDKITPEFLESVSIHTAPLDALTAALYDRFGIYTVYLGTLPKNDEINPITGEAFTKYHLGIAYQAAIRAQSQGILNRNPELAREKIDANREAASDIKFDSNQPNNFNHRTSVEGTRNIPTTRLVHQQQEDGQVRVVREDIPEEERGSRNGAIQKKVNDTISDEPLVEPNIRGGKGAVIRPNW